MNAECDAQMTSDSRGRSAVAGPFGSVIFLQLLVIRRYHLNLPLPHIVAV